MSGKGSRPRNCFSEAFRENYDRIFRKKADKTPTCQKVDPAKCVECGQPLGQCLCDHDDSPGGSEPEDCAYCRGSGQYDDATPCPWCDGDGTEPW